MSSGMVALNTAYGRGIMSEATQWEPLVRFGLLGKRMGKLEVSN